MSISNLNDINDFRISYASDVTRQIDKIESIVLKLENEIEPEITRNLLRKLLAEFHSIKGNSAALNFESVKIICHKVEDLMISEIDTSNKVKAEIIFKYLDAIKEYFNKFKSNGRIDESDYIQKYDDIFTNVELINQKKIINKEVKFHLNILIIGIPMTIIKNLKRMIPSIEFQVSVASNSTNAIERIAKEKFDLIISSYFIEPINGLTLCLATKSQWPNLNTKFILLPSQKLELQKNLLDSKYCPDIIIEKDENLHSKIVKYIKKLYLNYKEVKKIICFDDEENILELYKLIFDFIPNIEIRYIISESEFIKQIEEFKPELILSDVHLNNFSASGILKKYSHQSNFIFITGDTDSPQAKKLIKDGAIAIWEKSVITTDLIPKLIELEFEISLSDQ